MPILTGPSTDTLTTSTPSGRPSAVYYYYAFDAPSTVYSSINCRYSSDESYYDVSAVDAGQVGLGYVYNDSTYDGGSEKQYFAITDASTYGNAGFGSTAYEDYTTMITMYYNDDEELALYNTFTGWPTGSSYVAGGPPVVQSLIDDAIEEMVLQNLISEVTVKASFKKVGSSTGFVEDLYSGAGAEGIIDTPANFAASGSIKYTY